MADQWHSTASIQFITIARNIYLLIHFMIFRTELKLHPFRSANSSVSDRFCQRIMQAEGFEQNLYSVVKASI